MFCLSIADKCEWQQDITFECPVQGKHSYECQCANDINANMWIRNIATHCRRSSQRPQNVQLAWSTPVRLLPYFLPDFHILNCNVLSGFTSIHASSRTVCDILRGDLQCESVQAREWRARDWERTRRERARECGSEKGESEESPLFAYPLVGGFVTACWLLARRMIWGPR